MAMVAIPWSLSGLETTREIRGLEPRGGHLPQVWVSTVKLTPKAVAVTGSNRRAVNLKPLYSEAVGHL